MADQKWTELAEETSPADADILATVEDPSGSAVNKKITWANIKAVLKTYFDTLYSLVVKATGAELDTGTDDAKFATAEAIKDSHNVPSVAPGADGNVLTSDGDDWVSETPSGGSMAYKNGSASRAGNAASGTQTIAHGLGATPKKVSLAGLWFDGGDNIQNCQGAYDGTNNSCIWHDSYNTSGASTTKCLYFRNESTAGTQQVTCTVDETNIYLAWVLSGSTGSSNMRILWEVE